MNLDTSRWAQQMGRVVQRRWQTVAGVGLALVVLSGCGERPPVDTVQRGFRGTGMELVYNPRLQAEQVALNTPPAVLDAAASDGPRARDVYQNVQVLGDQSVAEFTRTMVAMTNWVSPQQGCVYCHNAQNFADDSIYTKIVARRMLQMTQTINADWGNHVGTTGVTCYTCHRGAPVPNEVWFKPLMPTADNTFAGNRAEQNAPAPAAALASLPSDPFTPFLLGDEPIGVIGASALPLSGPEGNRQSTKQAEWTYSLMMHMTKSLGVNCTQCHNTRSFADWGNSSPPRLSAWYGIRMTREVNNEYIVPLTDNFPAHRLGPTGDVAKVNCATCHQGAHKPLYGAQMAKDHPELLTKSLTPPAPATPAPMPEAATGKVGSLSADDFKALGQMSQPPLLGAPTAVKPVKDEVVSGLVPAVATQ